eukprot:m.276475 g.276475  ORF g.276475 m.276475 type:complete len:102 (-) comp19765_c1_seq2:33-338(-)
MDTAATDKEFSDFKEQFEGMQVDKSRIRLLRAWLTDHKISCSQGVELLQVLLGLGDVAISAATLMKPELLDPENIEPVLIAQGFKYDDEKEDARKALEVTP